MKKGTILTAIDPCVMESSKEPCLTVGKDYEVVSGGARRFCIIDDQGDAHYFETRGLDNWELYFIERGKQPKLLQPPQTWKEAAARIVIDFFRLPDEYKKQVLEKITQTDQNGNGVGG